MRHFNWIKGILFLVLIIHQVTSRAQPQERQIGANLTDLASTGVLWMYTNALKQSSSWLPRNADDPTDPINYSRDLRQEMSAAFDSDGYPLQVPFQFDHSDVAGKTLRVSCLVLHHQPEPYLYPAGAYLLVFEGQGTITVTGDIDGEFREFDAAGEHIVAVSEPSSFGIELTITASSADDPVRNVQLIFPEYTDTYQSEKFRADFIELASNFQSLRYMKPLRVENNLVMHWEDRPRTSNFSYFLDIENDILNGIPYEDIIELSNLTRIAPWICVPYRATDAYVNSLATLFHNDLSSDLQFYLEYGNENWNPSYPEKFQYVLDQGVAQELATSAHPGLAEQEAIHRFNSKRHFEIFHLFNEVFEDDSRVIKVLATQSDPFVADLVYESFGLAEVNPHNIIPDAVAIASYIGVTMFDDLEAQGLSICDHSASDLLDTLQNRVGYEMSAFVSHYAQLSRQHDVALFAYEGGQHVTEIGFQPMDPCAELLVAEMNRLQEMENFFCELYDSWYDDMDGGLFMLFNLAERPDAFGAFGILESQWQPLLESPKWGGLRSCVLAGPLGFTDVSQQDFIVYPNPVDQEVTIHIGSDNKGKATVRIRNLLGGEVFRREYRTVEEKIHIRDLQINPGLYVLEVLFSQQVLSSKITVHSNP